MDADLALLTRYHRHGDAAAFQELVNAHIGMLHATAVRTTRDAALASDVVQETFLALARAGNGAVQCVGAWLHQVAVRKAANVVRSECRRRRNETAAAGHLHQSPEETPWSLIEPVLDDVLETLPEPLRLLLIGHYLEQRSQTELAQRHGMSQSTISRQLDRGLQLLREGLYDRGITCTMGLGALLMTHTSAAVPTALAASMGKVALSAAGLATASLPTQKLITSLLMTTAGKTTLAAIAAVLAAVTLGNHLASPANARPVVVQASSTRFTPVPQQASRPPTQAAAKPEVSRQKARKVATPSLELGRKLLALKGSSDFKAFVIKTFALRDHEKMAAEIKRVMGLEVRTELLRASASSPTGLEILLISRMALEHPEEMLAWLSRYEGNTRLMGSTAMYQISKYHPHITAEAAAAFLPEGPNRALVLSLLSSQADPMAEVRRTLATLPEDGQRLEILYQISDNWPYTSITEATQWALNNLKGAELASCLPRLAQRLSVTSPDEAIALLGKIQEPGLLSKTLVDTMHGLVVEKPRMEAVTAVISRLQGQQRQLAISELSRRWVRVDEEGLMKWINQLESPEDFEAALPLTLPQLSTANYHTAMDTLVAQLDGKLDAALFKAATPDLAGRTRTTVDIIKRMTALPQYRSISAGQQGQQELLWSTINRAAGAWIKTYGGTPEEGAAWIDSLPFRTAADKAAVAAKLYEQWRPLDPTAATQWAVSAGVTVR